MIEKKIYLPDEESTIAFGEKLGKILPLPSVIYLEGDLGSGKTHLSKGIAKGLGITEDITSPTFTLINEYFTEKVKLYHLDLYRLDSLNAILDLGLEDFVDSHKSVVILEWSEKLNGYKLSKDLLEIKILHKDQGRDFIINSSSDKYDTLLI